MQNLFEPAINCPDSELKERFDRLVGLDDKKARLSKMLGILVNSKGLHKWAEKFHPNSRDFINILFRRPPLIVLEGDVGSGKTELATTIGDAVARLEKIEITVLPLSLSARGKGMVGEMTKLITEAFDQAIEQAKKYKSKSGKARSAVILLVDEADALTQSRASSQMHHEDKAGVNAFIRGIDRLGHGNLPIAVIMCSNRLNSLDPAVQRRAAEIMKFGRPTEKQRYAVIAPMLKLIDFTEEEIKAIGLATGPNGKFNYGFTFSDLTQRLMPSLILTAYPNGPVTPARAMEIIRLMNPTPPFREQS